MNAPIIYIDIETRSSSSENIRAYVTDKATAAKNLKDPEKIEASRQAARDKLISDMPLSPLWGEVAVICWSDGENQDHISNGQKDGEYTLLSEFNECMHQFWEENNKFPPTFCGFNIAQFDLRFLWLRMMVHGIKPAVNLQHDAKPWSEKVIDLRMILGGGDRYAPGTLEDYVVAFGGEPRGDDDISGAEVDKALSDGRLSDVIEHCRRDVQDCVWLHQRLLDAR